MTRKRFCMEINHFIQINSHFIKQNDYSGLEVVVFSMATEAEEIDSENMLFESKCL